MKVSTRVHYGLRAMTELASWYAQGKPLSISEIAHNEELPVAYLEQLVGELRRAGLVEGTRGARGGYRLARPPSEITVGEIYRVLEGEVAPVECTAESYLPGSCVREQLCLSRSIWGRVQDAVLHVLDASTLLDLLAEERPAGTAAAQFVPLESLAATATPAPTRLTGRSGEYAHA